MHDDTCETSLQCSWKRLCASIRDQLEDMTPTIPAMKSDELTAYAKTVENIFFIAKRAECMDNEIELENKLSLPREF